MYIATIVLACVHVLLQIQESYGQTAPSTTYLVALLGQRIQNETFIGDIEYKLVLTNKGADSVEVNITGIGGQIALETVGAGAQIEVTFNETMSLNGSEHSNKTIFLEAESDFDLHVFTTANGYTEGLLGIPIQSMNRSNETEFKAYDYSVATFCDTGGYCQLAVAALENDTVVSITLPSHINLVFCVGRSTFNSSTEKLITLQKYDSFQIETTFDLTGTHIYSHKPIAVFAGSRSIEAEGVIAHTMEQLFPTWLWGTEYVVAPIGDTSYGDIIKIAGSYYNVTVSMSGRQPFIMTQPYLAISRRLEVGTATYIHSTTPIQVIQISGLKYASNDTNETPALSMSVVPSFNNIADALAEAPDCSDETQVIVTDDSAGVGVKYTKYAIDKASYPQGSGSQKKPTINKCYSTATLPASYSFDKAAVVVEIDEFTPVPDIMEQTCYEGGRAFVKFDPSASTATPHRINLQSDRFHILKLRIQFCGEAVLQFFTSSGDLTDSLLVRISYNQITVTKCTSSDNCTTESITDSQSINNGDAMNCDVDMAFFWFWQNKTGHPMDICMGFGHKVNVNTNCTTTNTFSTSGKFTHVNVMGLFTDARFNWDFEHPSGCSLYEEYWRCFDRLSNCSLYGTAFCSDPAFESFANGYCSKYCGKCSADSYGRKFIVRIPGSDKIHVLVSFVNSGTGVAVLKTSLLNGEQKNTPVKKMDEYTRHFECTNCNINDEVLIFTDDEVTVTIMFTFDSKTMSYPVYPVDTYGYEYMILVNDVDTYNATWNKACQFTSEFSDIEVIPYVTNGFHSVSVGKYDNFEKKPLNLNFFRLLDSAHLSGSVLNFNKPVGVFCGSWLAGRLSTVNDDYTHMLPTNTWSTDYYIPALEPLNAVTTIDAEVFIISNADNTIVNISVGFDGTYPIYNRGEVIQIEIDVSSSYQITSTENIAVAVRVRSEDNTSTSYHIIPPVSDWHDYNLQSIPNMFMTEFWTTDDIVIDVRSFYGNDQQTSGGSLIKDAGNKDDFFRYVSLNQLRYGLSVITDQLTHKWLVMPFPRKVITRVHSQQKCVVSTDAVSDNLDGDCDHLVDEENCFEVGYGVYRQDTDLDGAFGEDCGSTNPGTSVAERPVDPVCLIIDDRPPGQCWTNCQCKCSMKKNYEETKDLTQEELEAKLEDDNTEIQNELKVDTVVLSSTTSQKLSKGDERQSAASIGYVGIAMFCIVFGAIFILDIGSLIRDARILWANLNDGFDRLFGC